MCLRSLKDYNKYHCVPKRDEVTGGWRVGKPEGKRPVERPRHRWVDNINMDLLEIGWGSVGWIGLPQVRDKWRTLVNVF
jgi:hypothetical protein